MIFVAAALAHHARRTCRQSEVRCDSMAKANAAMAIAPNNPAVVEGARSLLMSERRPNAAIAIE